MPLQSSRFRKFCLLQCCGNVRRDFVGEDLYFFPYVDITSKIWPPRRHGVTSLAREGDIWGALKKNVFILPISVVCYGMAIGLIRPEGYKLYSSCGD